ncbi:MAG: serine/threonine-protein kinase [Synechocystis sp.]|nr:serine/threonine-protein kinase [Synechocystis sp.]
MDLLCTRPGCARLNPFPDLDNRSTLQTAQQKFCAHCRMPLILAGRYLPVKLLGQGGFGAAYLALDRFTPTMRFCVVKQFQPSGNLSQDQLNLALSLFEREATVLEKLGDRHPQIPDLYAYFPLVVENPRTGKEDQFFYLVQEFISGQDLEKTIEHQGPLSEGQVRWVLKEMLGILAFVHGNGTIHRDIKPSNLIRNQEGQLFLLDFGAVKEVTTGNVNPGSSTGIYSMGFAPPEQMAGGQVYPATDLYALAVTCLYLLTGKTAQELYDAYHNQWNWRLPGLQVSDSLAQVLDRLLLPTPKDRYPDAESVLAALQGNGVSGATVPNPPTKIQPASPPSVISAPPPVPAPPPAAPGKIAQLVRQLPLIRVLLQAGFTGFVAILLWVAAIGLLPQPGISVGVWGMTLGGLIFAQVKRWLEQTEMMILMAVCVGAFWGLPFLKGLSLLSTLGAALQLPPLGVVIILGVSGAIAMVAITSLFLLILRLLFSLLARS